MKDSLCGQLLPYRHRLLWRSLKDTPAAEMGAIVVKEALNRAGVKPEQVDEVMFGCILTAGLGQNVARQVRASRPAFPSACPPTPWAWCAAPA